MRNVKLTQDEVLAAEEASANRHASRAQGFAKMHERDKAVQLLSNNALMLWHVPEDSFALDLRCPSCRHKKRYMFNLAEFRRWLRWA